MASISFCQQVAIPSDGNRDLLKRIQEATTAHWWSHLSRNVGASVLTKRSSRHGEVSSGARLHVASVPLWTAATFPRVVLDWARAPGKFQNVTNYRPLCFEAPLAMLLYRLYHAMQPGSSDWHAGAGVWVPGPAYSSHGYLCDFAKVKFFAVLQTSHSNCAVDWRSGCAGASECFATGMLQGHE